MIPEVLTLTPSQALWPRQLDDRLKSAAPSSLMVIGSQRLLAERKVGLFCSVRCPDGAALRAYDACRKLRDEDMTVDQRLSFPGRERVLEDPPRRNAAHYCMSGAVAAKNADSNRMEAGTGKRSPPHRVALRAISAPRRLRFRPPAKRTSRRSFRRGPHCSRRTRWRYRADFRVDRPLAHSSGWVKLSELGGIAWPLVALEFLLVGPYKPIWTPMFPPKS